MRTCDTCSGTMPHTAPCPFTGYRHIGRDLPEVIWWVVALKTRGMGGVGDTMGTQGWILFRMRIMKPGGHDSRMGAVIKTPQRHERDKSRSLYLKELLGVSSRHRTVAVRLKNSETGSHAFPEVPRSPRR